MAFNIKLPDGTVVECSSAEEAAAFVQKTSRRRCDRPGCDQPADGPPHCYACGGHHDGMC